MKGGILDVSLPLPEASSGLSNIVMFNLSVNQRFNQTLLFLIYSINNEIAKLDCYGFDFINLQVLKFITT